MHKTRMDKVKHWLGFQGLFTIDGIGHGGGLALLWKDNISLDIQSYSQRHINSWIISSTTNVPWMLTCFYGHPKTDKRIEGYQILRHLHTLDPHKWLCIGDFNEIIS